MVEWNVLFETFFVGTFLQHHCYYSFISGNCLVYFGSGEVQHCFFYTDLKRLVRRSLLSRWNLGLGTQS